MQRNTWVHSLAMVAAFWLVRACTARVKQARRWRHVPSRVGMLKSFFPDIRFSEPKILFFSIIVYQPTRETGSERRQVRMMSPAVRCQCADVSLVVPSAPQPRDPLQLRLQQQWCIPPTATVWRIQALARQTVARGIVDQQLLRRRTGAHQLQWDKADIKRHPADDMLRGGPTDKPGKRLPVSQTCELKATEIWHSLMKLAVFNKNTSKPPIARSQFRRAICIPHTGTGRRPFAVSIKGMIVGRRGEGN